MAAPNPAPGVFNPQACANHFTNLAQEMTLMVQLQPVNQNNQLAAIQQQLAILPALQASINNLTTNVANLTTNVAAINTRTANMQALMNQIRVELNATYDPSNSNGQSLSNILAGITTQLQKSPTVMQPTEPPLYNLSAIRQQVSPPHTSLLHRKT
jgi:hypothetical protein